MNEKNYLSEDELLFLIADAENGCPAKAPGYLKEQILKKTEKENAAEKKESLFLFSVKIIAAAAAAITLLSITPNTLQTADIAPDSASAKQNSPFYILNQKTSRFCELLSDATNSMFIKGDD